MGQACARFRVPKRFCIDTYSWPNKAGVRPEVMNNFYQAQVKCAAMGKRICDAHEWEGACQGRLRPPDYRFDLAEGVGPSEAVRRMRAAHNRAQAAEKRWSYGPAYQKGVCAAASAKRSVARREPWTL